MINIQIMCNILTFIYLNEIKTIFIGNEEIFWYKTLPKSHNIYYKQKI
jgi:hypothetical protein